MIEHPQDQIENKGEKEERKRKIIALALELSENRETFPFPGISPEAYARIKAVDEEFPDQATPIDALVEKFKKEGIKVVLGKNPESGNVYILPAQSDEIERDSVYPGNLEVNGVTDEKLKELILMSKS